MACKTKASDKKTSAPASKAVDMKSKAAPAPAAKSAKKKK